MVRTRIREAGANLGGIAMASKRWLPLLFPGFRSGFNWQPGLI